MTRLSKLKFLTIFIVMICGIIVCFYNVSASSASDVIVSFQIDNPIMEVNGAETEIDAGRGTTPVIIEERTLVPIRIIIESFGGNVEWNEETKSVQLTMNDDSIHLTIDSDIAYVNDVELILDTPPAIINERTMLPVRFIAENFNIGVSWEEDTRTITLIRNTFDAKEYDFLVNTLPDYCGAPYAYINNNVPMFKEYEIISGSFEYYSELDELGRCDVCMASISEDLMPYDERESIGEITPSGWINAKYDTISGKYLYNRCHLIGYQLTGENANEKNLITGTRYLNIEGMLPFENMIDDYIESSDNHVMYRVTPLFKDANLVADGVLLEAYSIEDDGAGISFCVFCYNVQPTILIDYTTGKSRLENETAEDVDPETETLEQIEHDILEYEKVYRTPAGKKYHSNINCGGINSYEITLTDAINSELEPCSKCIS